MGAEPVRNCKRKYAQRKQNYCAVGNSQFGQLDRANSNSTPKRRDGQNSYDQVERKDGDDRPHDRLP